MESIQPAAAAFSRTGRELLSANFLAKEYYYNFILKLIT
jgi:hypothetical protein